MIVVKRRRQGIDATWSSHIAYELRCLQRHAPGIVAVCAMALFWTFCGAVVAITFGVFR